MSTHQACSAMLKAVHCFLQVLGSIPRQWQYFLNLFDPVSTKDPTGTRDTWAIRVPLVGWSHRYMWHASLRVPQVGGRWRTVWHVRMKGPTGQIYWRVPQVHRDFYGEMQASHMSNCRSHRYTSDGEGSQGIERIECRRVPHRMLKGPTGTWRLLWRNASVTDE
jgi:hypothetical protein